MTSGTATRSRWRSLLWIVPAVLALLAVVVVAAIGLRALPAVQDFLEAYPGTVEPAEGAATGVPAWLGWQHFLNGLFLLLIVRTGWQIRTTSRPTAYWTRTLGPTRPGKPPVRISLTQWTHLALDVLWIANGVLFVVLLFASGRWVRIVPTSWDVIPNAASALLQYLSLNWPVENGWVSYNSLQVLAYFVTVFVAAPLAILTGLRMTPGLAAWWKPRERMFPMKVARAIHFPVMLYFVAFTIVHVTLVLATGATRNINHMYAGRDDASWWGLAIFAGSLVVMAVAWVALRPTIVAAIAGLAGSVRRG